MATITVPGMFLTGTHGSRPAASSVGKGTLYACSTHNLIYQTTDGSSWTTWLMADASGAVTPTSLILPAATSPAQTAEGSVVWDSDDDVLTIGDGAARSTFGKLGSTTGSAVGTAAAGTSKEASRVDHVHPTGAGTPTTQAFGDAAATGSGPAAAMTDHKHAMPAAAITSSGHTMATGKLLGRSTASTGAIEEITVGSGLSLAGGSLSATGGGGSALTVKDEGSNLDTAVTSIDFVGAGVTASAVGHAITVTVAGGGSSPTAEVNAGARVYANTMFR